MPPLTWTRSESTIPPSFEPSDDITILEGLEPIDNLEERRKELRELARSMAKGKAVDAEIINEEEDE